MKRSLCGFVSSVVLMILMFVLVGCGGNNPATSDEKTPTVLNISGTPDEKVQQIAQIVTAEYAGQLVVSYAENPEHRLLSGRIYYGSHYIILVLPQTEPEPQISEQTWKTAVGRLYQLTYEHILRDEREFTHAGVQVIEPDAWLIGGHNRGAIIMFEAAEEDLEKVSSSPYPSLWLAATSEQRLNGANFQALLIELTRLQKLVRAK